MDLKYDADGLIPAIVQDAASGEVLMLAFMNEEALRRTQQTGQAWFYSRSRQELWHKGATSGSYLHVERIVADCDSDTLLLQVHPAGPACHTGERSCFFGPPLVEAAPAAPGEPAAPQEGATGPRARRGRANAAILEEVFEVILERQRTRPEGSYVNYLLTAGLDKISKKVLEEAAEAIIAAKNGQPASIAAEVADLWFHTLVLLAACGIRPKAVWEELARRRK